MRKNVFERLEKSLDRLLRYKYDENGLITEKRVRISELELANYTEEEMQQVFDYLNTNGIVVTGSYSAYYSFYDNYKYVNRQRVPIEYTRLSYEKQLELLKDYKENNNIDSRNELVMSYGRMIFIAAEKYTRKYNIDYSELVNCGFIGAIEAINNYKFGDYNMSTYIGRCIYGNIQTHIRRYYGYKSVYNDGVLDEIIEELKEKNNDLRLNEYEYVDEIIDKYIENSKHEEKDRTMLNLYYSSSLDDILEDSNAVDDVSLYQEAIEGLYQEQVSQRINKLLGCLTKKEQETIKKYYGLDGNDVHTLTQIAEERNVTQQAVQKMVKNSLFKLEHYHGSALKELYDTITHEYDYSSENTKAVKVARKI